jgi:hypothetical protein
MKIPEALRGISILFLCYNEVCVDMIPEQRTQNPAAAGASSGLLFWFCKPAPEKKERALTQEILGQY